MAANEENEEADAGRLSNPIACGSCRQKKRKVGFISRLTFRPHCLQCNDQPLLCQYPEQNKRRVSSLGKLSYTTNLIRGIPIGFINRLEARLVETEDALLRVIHSMNPGSVDALPSRSTQQQSKSSKINEWDSLPLQSMDDIKVWYRLRTGLVLPSISFPAEQHLPQTTRAYPLEFDSAVTTSVQINSPVSTGQAEILSQAGPLATPPDGRGVSPRADGVVASGVLAEGKAEQLRKSQSHIYF
ncbi:hypothetical protein S40288_03855 [Stachybotrys chartarum IBT 40288]|nr:hypothetical protein S40288_03855 [Stachybotrys chartarum IBT 40288]